MCHNGSCFITLKHCFFLSHKTSFQLSTIVIHPVLIFFHMHLTVRARVYAKDRENLLSIVKDQRKQKPLLKDSRLIMLALPTTKYFVAFEEKIKSARIIPPLRCKKELGGDFAPGQNTSWEVDTGEESRSPRDQKLSLWKANTSQLHFKDGPFPSDGKAPSLRPRE